MPATISAEAVGVKETIKALRQVDPEYRKQFTRDIKSVVAPLVSEAKSLYPAMPLSGMARAWGNVFPWQVSRVRSSVKVKTSTRRGARSVVYVSQGSPAGVVFETVTTGNNLGRNIRARSDRVLWPTADRHAGQIAAGVEQIVRDAEKVVQGMLP